MKNCFIKNKIKQMRGYSLVDLLVAMGLISVAVVMTMSAVQFTNHQQTQENQINSMFAIREHLFNTLNKYYYFQNSIHYIHPESAHDVFACLRARSDCSSLPAEIPASDATQPTKRNFTLFGPGGGIVYDPTDPVPPGRYNGFKEDGTTCSDTEPTPNPACPIRVDFTWEPICTTCDPGMIMVEVRFRTHNAYMNQTRARNFNFFLLKTYWTPTYIPAAPTYPSY